MLILSENSLYKTPAERDELLKDKKKVADALLFNYFGFISLFAALPRKDVKEWKNNELQVKVDNIGDENTDVSLSVKLSLEAGNITRSTADKLTKLLSLFKQGKILKAKDIDNEKIHELFQLCRFETAGKPTAQLMDVVKEYSEREINIAFLGRELYRKSRLPALKEASEEFRFMFKNSSYLIVYSNLENGVSKIDMGVPTRFIKNQTPKMIVFTPGAKSDTVVLPDTTSNTILSVAATDAVDQAAVNNVAGIKTIDDLPINSPATEEGVGAQKSDGTLNVAAVANTVEEISQNIVIDPVKEVEDQQKSNDKIVQVTPTETVEVNGEFDIFADESVVLDTSKSAEVWNSIRENYVSNAARHRYTVVTVMSMLGRIHSSNMSSEYGNVRDMAVEEISKNYDVDKMFTSIGNYIQAFKDIMLNENASPGVVTSFMGLTSYMMEEKGITPDFISIDELKEISLQYDRSKVTQDSALFQALLMIYYQYSFSIHSVKNSLTYDLEFLGNKLEKNGILYGGAKVKKEVIRLVRDFGIQTNIDDVTNSICSSGRNQIMAPASLYTAYRIIETLNDLEPMSIEPPIGLAVPYGIVCDKLLRDDWDATKDNIMPSWYTAGQRKEVATYYSNMATRGSNAAAYKFLKDTAIFKSNGTDTWSMTAYVVPGSKLANSVNKFMTYSGFREAYKVYDSPVGMLLARKVTSDYGETANGTATFKAVSKYMSDNNIEALSDTDIDYIQKSLTTLPKNIKAGETLDELIENVLKTSYRYYDSKWKGYLNFIRDEAPAIFAETPQLEQIFYDYMHKYVDTTIKLEKYPLRGIISECCKLTDGKILPPKYQGDVNDFIYKYEVLPTIVDFEDKLICQFDDMLWLNEKYPNLVENIILNKDRIVYDLLPLMQKMFDENSKNYKLLGYALTFVSRFPDIPNVSLIGNLVNSIINKKFNDIIESDSISEISSIVDQMVNSTSENKDSIVITLRNTDAYKKLLADGNTGVIDDIESTIKIELTNNPSRYIDSVLATIEVSHEKYFTFLKESGTYDQEQINERTLLAEKNPIISNHLADTLLIELEKFDTPLKNFDNVPITTSRAIAFAMSRMEVSDISRVIDIEAFSNREINDAVKSLNLFVSDKKSDPSDLITIRLVALDPLRSNAKNLDNLLNQENNLNGTYTTGLGISRVMKQAIAANVGKLMEEGKFVDASREIRTAVMTSFVKEQYDGILEARVDVIKGILEGSQFDQTSETPEDEKLISIAKINGLGFETAQYISNYDLTLPPAELKENVKVEFTKAVDYDLDNTYVMVTDDISVDPKILAEASRYLDSKVSGRHGDMRPFVTKVYDVNMSRDKFNAFVESDKLNPKSDSKGEVETFMVHGTGAMAIPFIAKFGFRDIPEGVGIEIAGKMLGNGIYLAKDVDKSLSYLGDGGFSRGTRNFGYMLECEVCLGEYGIDYMDGRGQYLVSPEWVTFKFDRQIVVKKIYQIASVSSREFNEEMAKYES